MAREQYNPAMDPINHCACGGVRNNRPCTVDCPLWSPLEDPECIEQREWERERDREEGRYWLDDLEL